MKTSAAAPKPLPDLARHLTAFNEAQAAVMAAPGSFSDAVADEIAQLLHRAGLLMSPADPGLVAPLMKRGAITPPIGG
jgi:hypothetical protein